MPIAKIPLLLYNTQLMKKIVLPLLAMAVLSTGGVTYALTRDEAPVQTDSVIVEAPVETPVETPVEQTPEKTEPKKVVEKTVQEEPVEPVDTRPEWRKFFDEKLASDPDAPYIIKCIEHNTSIHATGVDSRFWSYGDEYRNGFAETAYQRVKSRMSVYGLSPSAFADKVC